MGCFAQMEIVPIQRSVPPNTSNRSARTASADPLPLPFWDDFSFGVSKGFYPNEKFWVNSESVWVNSGTGINPPSLNVATFDGYDAEGKPHSVNLLDKGLADSLTSQPLKLKDVVRPIKVPIFISFYYQSTGNGEAPDGGDVLSLLFKDKKGKWNEVWNSDEDKNRDSNKFTKKIVLIPTDSSNNKPNYFHNNFQFRFQNFGRLSGPYDTWNVDYVYVNNGKEQYHTTNNPTDTKGFPDRAIVYSLTSPFEKDYTSVPVKHFFSNPLNKLDTPYVLVKNRREDLPQQMPLSSKAIINTKSQGSATILLKNGGGAKRIFFDQKMDKADTIYLDTIPSTTNLAAFKDEKDSLSITFDTRFNTADNVNKIAGIKNTGDFDTLVFEGIKFTNNDAIKNTFLMQNYYAYDDGVAEYGAKLTGIGSQLAYQFDLITPEPQTITAINVYLPKFGDESSQTFQLQIMRALTGNESDYLLKTNTTIERNSLNKFWTIPIASTAVQGRFYVGWRTTSTALIPVGVDFNTNTGDKMFYNVSGIWEQNTEIKGSLMIRPVFGEPAVITNVADLKSTLPHPNPTHGTFFLANTSEQIQLFNFSGQEVKFEVNEQFDKKQITINDPTTGLYVVRYFDKIWQTEKIMVQP
jgi:Secretion system C-terminal sorting domain